MCNALDRYGVEVYERERNLMLTIVSVLYRNAQLFELNHQLTQQLNEAPHQWLVADNELGPNLGLTGENISVIEGAEPVKTRDAGSLHHAEAIEKCLDLVDTRFVLLIDPDFFVFRPDWIAQLLAHVRQNDLHFFGSVWHPRWYYQYRYFPTVHFMLIDLEKVPRRTLNFRPLIDQDWFWHQINNPRRFLPDWLRLSLKVERIRDTGWQVYKRHANRKDIRYETLLPSYRPPKDLRTKFESLGLLPDRFCLVPQRKGAFTTESFLEGISPQAWQHGWEEFYWQGAPFAFHLRCVGRKSDGESELALLTQTLDDFL